ncbi:hypothetical protein C8Q74DRAFT_114308 [Fomes fomentarius]|nr:hypothetical protein C8Q74DRAFT_114308 [Fomes fomentarius]
MAASSIADSITCIHRYTPPCIAHMAVMLPLVRTTMRLRLLEHGSPLQELNDEICKPAYSRKAAEDLRLSLWYGRTVVVTYCEYCLNGPWMFALSVPSGTRPDKVKTSLTFPTSDADSGYECDSLQRASNASGVLNDSTKSREHPLDSSGRLSHARCRSALRALGSTVVLQPCVSHSIERQCSFSSSPRSIAWEQRTTPNASRRGIQAFRALARQPASAVWGCVSESLVANITP